MRKLFMVLLLMFSIASVAFAEVNKVTVKVDGLSCAFCAYGLQKGLKKVEGVQEVKIFVDAGRAELKVKPGAAVGIEEIESAVKKAGYTPRAITVEATGNVVDWNGRPVLAVSPGDIKFLLEENESLRRLQEVLGEQEKDRMVAVSGQIKSENPESHHGHPLTLQIEQFELK